MITYGTNQIKLELRQKKSFLVIMSEGDRLSHRFFQPGKEPDLSNQSDIERVYEGVDYRAYCKFFAERSDDEAPQMLRTDVTIELVDRYFLSGH